MSSGPRQKASLHAALHVAALAWIEHLGDLHLAEKRWKALRAGRSKTIPLAQVVRCYGLGKR